MIEIKKDIYYSQIAPFEMRAAYVENCDLDKGIDTGSHVHPECEIYINIMGDVSFMVENRIYPIFTGSVVISRPYEYHHCIYHSNEPHKHFWILFKPNGNDRFFEKFFVRSLGEKNLLTVPPERQKELFDICYKLSGEDLSEFERYYLFFKLIYILNDADSPEIFDDIYSKDMALALSFIDEHFCDHITVSDISLNAHVSINTLERHFLETLHMTPSTYLKKKRLANAAEMLYNGHTVTEACQESGFADYSSFIAIFKKNYGMTPLKYKKHIEIHK